MTDLSSVLQHLVDTALGQPVAGIHFLPRTLLGTDEALATIGIDPAARIHFEVLDHAYPVRSGRGSCGTAHAVGGVTVCATRGASIVHHVFVSSDPPHAEHVSERHRTVDLLAHQVIALAHELGHVRDMALSINFRFHPTPTVMLAPAEAEAHAFALDYCGSSAPELRSLLAAELLRFADGRSAHERAVFVALCKRVGKGRLKRWSAAR